MIDRLEGRLLFADGTAPTLDAVRLVGTPGQATGIALTFSEPMDPVRAADADAYEVRGTWRDSLSHLGPRHLDIATAAYDDATRTVTLTPERSPFDAGRYLRRLRVDDAVTDASGTRLDGDDDGHGGDDAVWFFAVRTGRTVKYRDATRSRVGLRLAGPGRLRLIQRLEGTTVESNGLLNFKLVHWGEGMQLYVENAAPDSVLTGSVRPHSGGGTANTTLAEIINPGGARLDLLTNPSFHVGT